MSFEEDVEQRLAAVRHTESQNAIAEERSLRAALEALDRLQTKCKEAAAFLASHGVPTEPIVADQLKQGILSGAKVIQQTLGQGWFLRRHGPGIVLAPGGHLWHTGLGGAVNGRNLHKSAPFYFNGIRQSLQAGERVKSPLEGFSLEFPRIYWSSPDFLATGTEGVMIRFNHHDAGPGDVIESIITAGVVRLVGNYRS
ncbi:hypothetical protein [Arthrobacter sp. D3-16]